MQPSDQPGENTAAVFVSPHLDDAVLSCGALLARCEGPRIVTVFAGHPHAVDPNAITEWDQACGFVPGDDVVGARRAEDASACAAVGASPVWLDFVDGQYSEPATLDDITSALRDIVAPHAPVDLFIPLGLIHPDHEQTHEAARRLAGTADCTVYAYEDSPYRAHRRAVDKRIAELGGAGFRPEPAAIEADGRDPRKRAAIACYGSQVGALERAWPGWERALEEERYWRLRR